MTGCLCRSPSGPVLANGAAPYRSAKPPTPQKCSGECSERCRPETGCSGKRLGKCSSSLFLEETQGASTFPSTSPSTRFWPAPLQALSRALLGGWGFCTSVGGRPVRKHRAQECAKSVEEAGRSRSTPAGGHRVHKTFSCISWFNRSRNLFVLETTFPLTSAIVSDVVRMRFGCGSDVVRIWFGCGSDVVRTWFGCGPPGPTTGRGSDVGRRWLGLSEVKGKWFPAGSMNMLSPRGSPSTLV